MNDLGRIEALEARIAVLEARLAALESPRPGQRPRQFITHYDHTRPQYTIGDGGIPLPGGQS